MKSYALCNRRSTVQRIAEYCNISVGSCHEVRVEKLTRKRPEVTKNEFFVCGWLHHPENVPAHTSLLTRDFSVKNHTNVLPYPSYSADLALADLFYFQNLKGQRFTMVDKIK